MRIVRKSLEGVCVFLLAGIVLVPLVQVIMRDVFIAPLVGAEELTRFLLVCLVFVGYPLVVDTGENILMGELRDGLPSILKRFVNVLIFLGTVIASAFIAYATFLTIQANLDNTTPTLKIPFWIFLGATVFGFFTACLVHVTYGFRPPKPKISTSQ